MGLTACDLPAIRSIRQRPSDAGASRHNEPVAQRERQRIGLGDRARKLRGRVRGRRRPCSSRFGTGGRHRVAMFTRAGVERIMRFAFRLAQSRPRKLLTVVTKSNAQRHAMVMWDEIATEIASEFKDGTWDKMLVDAMTMRMVMRPETIDTVVATNLHADILSDLAAALAGSLGIAPTANLNPERTFPSMFEPIHGSAFDIMGKGIANPVGTFWSAAML